MGNNYDNIISIKFAQAQRPKFEERKGKGYIEFGAENNYPNYLLDLFNESPKHGAIIKGKANYIFGKGFKDIPTKANTKGESWNQVWKKVILDDEIFCGYYLQIIYNLLGKIKDVYHIEFQKVRTNKEMSEFRVKNDWSNNKEEARIYPSFNISDPKGSQILYVKQYNPNCDVYPLPGYYPGLNYIESDVQVSRHILGNAKDGFVATTLVNLNGGEPAEEHKAAVEKGIKKKFTGSEGDRVVIMFNSSKENSAEIVPLSSTMLTKEDFTNVNNLIQQEIFACHQITSPALFGISTPGSLGQRNEIQDAYEIFNNTYVNERQQAHEEVLNKLLSYTGVEGDFEIIPVEPLGFSIKEESLLELMPREYFFDKLGVDEKYYNLPPAKGTAQPQQQTDASGNVVMSNDNLKNLTGRQFQGVMRIVNKYTLGKLTKEQAALMLKNGFAFTDEDVTTFLGLDSDPNTFKSQDDIDFELVEQFSQFGESRAEYEVLSKKIAREAEYFADVKELNQLDADVLNLIKKDKRITSEVIATTLKKDVAVINKVISKLERSGVLTPVKTKVGEDTIIERTSTGKGIDIPRASTTDIVLRYAYEGPKDSRNRPFCAKMMELDRLYSRADIENISIKLGYSVWDRRGGWLTLPDGEHRPYCRHDWFALTVIRK
jgi:DNA-binding Lrp family transcriptional regulator